MEEKLTKELAQKLMEIEGEVRGVVFETDAGFVLKEKGREGLKKVEAELKRLGYPIDYDKVRPMDFYPLGLRILSLLAIQKVFNFSNEEMRRMGAQAPKRSLIPRLFLRFFVSVTRMAELSSKMWREHYTVGSLSVEAKEEERKLTVRLKAFALHPILCPYLEGYFATILEMGVGVPVTSKETKCSFRGDEDHEFLLEW